MTRPITALLLSALLLGPFTLADDVRAGQLEPPGPPGPTMHSLDEIYTAVTEGAAPRPEDLRSGMVVWDYRSGTHPTGPATLMTVPADETFVLTRVLLTPHCGIGSCQSNIGFSFSDGTSERLRLYMPGGPTELGAGIPFAGGSTITVELTAGGDPVSANVVYSVVILGHAG